MNSAGRFHIVLIVFLLAMLGYCCHIVLHPSFAIISLTHDKNTPSYTHNTTIYMLDSYIPQVTAKALDKLF